MEFKANVLGKNYTFNVINNTSVLISGQNAEYILYKTKQWNCADDIAAKLLKILGEVIEERLRVYS